MYSLNQAYEIHIIIIIIILIWQLRKLRYFEIEWFV